MNKYNFFLNQGRLIGFLAFFPLNSCVHQGDINEEFFLPCGYSGWVNIIYDHAGQSRFFKSENSNIFLLTGDLTNCYVDTSPEEGNFVYSYYRYCDSIMPVISKIRYKTHVPINYMTSIEINNKIHIVHSFYVSREAMDMALADDAIPKNPLNNFVHFNK